MKKTFNLNVRVADSEWNVFRKACETVGVKASPVIRDLCRALVPYIADQCKDGRWRPPVLITERQAGALDIHAEIAARPLSSTARAGAPAVRAGVRKCRVNDANRCKSRSSRAS